MGHCHSVMHEYETKNIQVLSTRLYKFSRFLGGGDSRAPYPLYETLPIAIQCLFLQWHRACTCMQLHVHVFKCLMGH